MHILLPPWLISQDLNFLYNDVNAYTDTTNLKERSKAALLQLTCDIYFATRHHENYPLGTTYLGKKHLYPITSPVPLQVAIDISFGYIVRGTFYR